MKNIFEAAYYLCFVIFQEFIDHVEKLWADEGVQECYNRSHEHEFQLIDSAK